MLLGAYEGQSVWPLLIANSAKALTLVVCLCQHGIAECGSVENNSYAVLFLDPLTLSTQLYSGEEEEKKRGWGDEKLSGKIDSFSLWFNCKLECTSLWDARALFVIKKKGFIAER